MTDLEEWRSELMAASTRPDRGDDGHTAWEITEKGRQIREQARRRLDVLDALVAENKQLQSQLGQIAEWANKPLPPTTDAMELRHAANNRLATIHSIAFCALKAAREPDTKKPPPREG